MIEETFSYPYVYDNSPKMFQNFYLGDFSNLATFFRHSVGLRTFNS